MFNYYLCVIWPILFLGVFVTYKIGEEQWGRKGSLFLPLIFIAVYILILWLWVGEGWWLYSILPVLDL